MRTIDPDTLGGDDEDGRRLERLAALLREELDELVDLLPAALDAQWTAAPVERARWDTTERSKGELHRPTEDVALDGRRLALRAQVLRSSDVLVEAVRRTRGVRRGLELALDRWEGEA